MRRARSGLTLVELLLAIAVASVLLGALSGVFVLSLQSRAKQHVITEVEQQGAWVLETITNFVRSASAITAPQAGSSGSTVVFAMSQPSQNPTRLEFSNGRLWLTQGSAATQALTSSRVVVFNAQFQHLAAPSTPGALRVTVILAAFNPQNRHEYAYNQTLTTTVALRR